MFKYNILKEILISLLLLNHVEINLYYINIYNFSVLDRNCIVKRMYYMTYILYYIDSVIYFDNIGEKGNAVESRLFK